VSNGLTTDPAPRELELVEHRFQVSRMLRLVADLGVTDTIPPEEQVSVQEVAASRPVVTEPLLRVLRALAAFRVFLVTSDGTVAHTARSRLLRTEATSSMHHSARFWTGRGSWGAWRMLDDIREAGTGRPARPSQPAINYAS
jgi:hypothetical protein